MLICYIITDEGYLLTVHFVILFTVAFPENIFHIHVGFTELDESMLDALGILPQRKQHKKLLLVSTISS
jgi:hypothetical protein